MSYEMNLVFLTEPVWQTFRETVNLANILLYLAQIARLVERLMRCMLQVKVVLPVDGPSQAWSIVNDVAIGLEVDNADNLLI